MIQEWELEQQYEAMLDDCYPMVCIGDMEYEPSRVLKEVDPIAFRVGMFDYADSLIEDGEIEGVEGF